MRAIIVGIDPGLTTAISAFDLKGNFIAAFSKKNVETIKLAKFISELGQPLIFAVDKAKPPAAAEKLAASFACKLFAPQSDLKIVEKSAIVKDVLSDLESENSNIKPLKFSSHEKDAIAAAIAAYKMHATEFSKIDDSLGALGMEQYGDVVKCMLLRGEVKNISEAVARLVSEQKPVVKRQQNVTVNVTQNNEARKVRELDNRLQIQKVYIEKLEERLKSVEKSKEQLLESQLKQNSEARRQVLRQKEIVLRDSLIAGLKEELEGLRKIKENLQIEVARHDEVSQILEENCVPVVPVKEYSREALAAADSLFKIKGCVVWIQNFHESNAATKFLIALSPRIVIGKIVDAARDKLVEAGIGVVACTPQQRHLWAFIPEKELEAALSSTERKNFLRWLEAYKMRES